MKTWQSMIRQYRVGLFVTLTAAALLNTFFSFSHAYWLLLSTFIVTQIDIGTPLRQSANFMISMILAVIIAGFMQALPLYALSAALAMVFIAGGYLHFRYFASTWNAATVFLITFYLAIFTAADSHVIVYRFLDILLGGGIGIIGLLFLYPTKLGTAFRLGLIPLLNAMTELADAIHQAFLQQDFSQLTSARLQVERALARKPYPEWAYAPGFNPGLRGGFRFFLLNIEQVADALVAMSYEAELRVAPNLLSPLVPDLTVSMACNRTLLQALYAYFKEDKLEDKQADFTNDLPRLDEATREVVPNNLELLDIDPDYVTITAFVRHIKDIRERLLQLMMALINGKGAA